MPSPKANSCPSPAIPLTEDEIDDIVYVARANELPELIPYLDSLTAKYNTPKDSIISSAIDAESGNTALHYASANGHLGRSDIIPSGSHHSSARRQH